MTETIQTGMDRLMTISAEPRDYIAGDGLLYCGSCNTPRKRSSQTEECCLGVTAIRLNASADKKPGKSRRKKSGQGCITRTCGG